MVETKNADTEAETNAPEKSVYEFAYHLSQGTSESARNGALSFVRAVVEKLGGSFISESSPEETNLAYKMRGSEGKLHDNSHFGWLKFNLESSNATKMLEEIKKSVKEFVRTRLFRTVASDTRAIAQVKHGGTGLVQEVAVKGTLENKTVPEDSAVQKVVSDKQIDEALDDLTKVA